MIYVRYKLLARRLTDLAVSQMAVSDSDIGEERNLRELFRRTAGEDLEVDPYELRTILDSNFKHGESVSQEQFTVHAVPLTPHQYVGYNFLLPARICIKFGK